MKQLFTHLCEILRFSGTATGSVSSSKPLLPTEKSMIVTHRPFLLPPSCTFCCLCQSSNPFAEELIATAQYISKKGRGILASDESNATTGKRLAAVGIENTVDDRRAWRELLYTAPGKGEGGASV